MGAFFAGAPEVDFCVAAAGIWSTPAVGLVAGWVILVGGALGDIGAKQLANGSCRKAERTQCKSDRPELKKKRGRVVFADVKSSPPSP